MKKKLPISQIKNWEENPRTITMHRPTSINYDMFHDWSEEHLMDTLEYFMRVQDTLSDEMNYTGCEFYMKNEEKLLLLFTISLQRNDDVEDNKNELYWYCNVTVEKTKNESCRPKALIDDIIYESSEDFDTAIDYLVYDFLDDAKDRLK